MNLNEFASLEQKQTGKDFIDFSKIINCAIASSSVESIEFKLGKKKHFLRPQQHCIIFGKSGIGKSTILKTILEKFGGNSIVSMTKATLFGSFDRETFSFIEPLFWQYRNSLIVLDELHLSPKRDREVLDAFLMLLENMPISKQLHGHPPELNLLEAGNYLKIKNKVLSFSAKTTIIASTMHHPLNFKSESMRALYSRCVIINFNPPIEELERYLYGEDLFLFKKIEPKKNIVIKQKDSDYIYKIVSSFNMPPYLVMRCLGDCLRYFAISKKHEENIYKRLCASKMLYDSSEGR